MTIRPNKETLTEKRDAIVAALTAAFSAAGAYTEHVVTNRFQRLQDHADADLQTGVVIVLMDNEGEYSQRIGMTGKDGTLSVLVVYHFRVAENASPTAIEDAEILFAEEMKAFCRAGVSGLDLLPQQFQLSLQRHHPYGFVAGRLSAVSPRHTQS